MTKISIIKCSSYADCVSVLADKVKCTSSLTENNIVFCEDKLTLTIEKAILKKYGGSFDTVVTTFKRFLAMRSSVDNVLNKSGSAVVLKRILNEHNSDFKYVCKKNYASLPLTVYNVISQLISSNVTAEDIAECAEKTEGVLSAKLQDISLAYKLYFDEINDKWLDSGTYLSELPKVIAKDENISGQDVYLVGYSSWTAQAVEIVKSLCLHAKSVTLFTVYGENEGVYLNEIYNKFTKACRKINAEYTEETYENVNEKQCVKLLKKYLYNPEVFSKSYKPDTNAKGVFVYKAKDVGDECEYVAKIIKDGVIDKGKRYRDFAVATGSMSNYLGTVKRVFDEYGIPMFCDVKKKLSDSLAFRFVEKAFLAVKQNFDKDDVYALIENKLFLNDVAKKDAYTRKAKAKGFNRVRFLRGFNDGESEPVTKKLNKIKEITIKNGTAQAYADAIATLFSAFNVEKEIKNVCQTLNDLGEREESAFLSQCVKKLNELTKTISDLYGELPIKLDEYLQLLKAGAEASEIAVIPQSSDAVYFAELKDIRLRNVDTLFAIGLNGDIPFGKSDTALLTDADLDSLEDLRSLIEPKVALVNDREKENLCLALLSFKDRLVLSNAIKTATGEKNSESEIIMYIEKIFGEKISKNFKDLRNTEDVRIISRNYLSYKPAVKEFAKNCSSYAEDINSDLDAPSSFYHAVDQDSKELLKQIVADGKKPYSAEKLSDSLIGENISVSKLESYFSCPYKEFANHTLKLAEEESGEIKPLDIGNIIHNVLDSFVSGLDNIKNIEDVKKYAEKYADEVISSDEYKGYAETPKGAYRLNKTKDESVRIATALYEQFSNSSFKPYGTELSFGKGEKLDGVKIAGKKGDAILNGKIDRVDVSEKYARVIDYKTGSEIKNLEELLYTGNKIQAFLYLHALKGLGKIPSGVYYEYLRDSFNDGKKLEYALEGFTLNSEEVVRASDGKIDEDGKSAILDVTLKDGKVKDKKSVLEEDVFNAFVDYSYKVAASGVSDMQDGFIAPTPYKESCKYCEYNALCGFENNVTGITRQVSNVTKETILNIKDEEGGNV